MTQLTSRATSQTNKKLRTHRAILAILCTSLCMWMLAFTPRAEAQTVHQRAEAAQTRSDHRHHTGAKIVGGSAAAGAVVGAVAGGGKGALIGGAIGAGGGAVANHVRKQRDVRSRERTGRYRHRRHYHHPQHS